MGFTRIRIKPSRKNQILIRPLRKKKPDSDPTFEKKPDSDPTFEKKPDRDLNFEKKKKDPTLQKKARIRILTNCYQIIVTFYFNKMDISILHYHFGQ